MDAPAPAPTEKKPATGTLEVSAATVWNAGVNLAVFVRKTAGTQGLTHSEDGLSSLISVSDAADAAGEQLRRDWSIPIAPDGPGARVAAQFTGRAGAIAGFYAGGLGNGSLILAEGARPVALAVEGAEVSILGRPFRAANAARTPNAAATDSMSEMLIYPDTDCSSIAEHLLDTVKTGRILRAEPKGPGSLSVLEKGAVEPNQWYHEAYTDGAYVFDPRMSATPIPKGDWTKVMRILNPGASIRAR
jgi:hypothetical protein